MQYEMFIIDRRNESAASKAANTILKLADSGNISAIVTKGFWGKMGYNGATSTKNAAIPYLQRAADALHPLALTQLGLCYAKGECGLPVDKGKAKYYLSISDACGDQWAKKELDKLNNPNNSSSSDGCFITTAVCQYLQKPDDCYELTVFRNFRDNWLKKQPDGKQLICEYYQVAPTIVSCINRQPDKDNIYQTLLNNYLSPCLKFIEQREYAMCRDLYVKMVSNLKEKYYSEANKTSD